MKAIDIARGVRDLFRDEDKWMQGDFAITDDGEDCDPVDDRASCFCLQGAIDRVSGTDFFSSGDMDANAFPEVARAAKAFSDVISETGLSGVSEYGRIVTFNDDEATTVEMIQEVCEKVVERLETEKGA